VSDDVFKELMKRKVMPNHNPKYEGLQNTQWSKIDNIFKSCCKFEPNSKPTATQILTSLIKNEPDQLKSATMTKESIY
jgi:hypothetical protein